jgi:hypothetical protein
MSDNTIVTTLVNVTSQAAGTLNLTLQDLNDLDFDTVTVCARASAGNITVSGVLSINADKDFTYPTTAFDVIPTVSGTTNPKGRVKDATGNDWGPYLSLDVVTTSTADIEVYLVGQKRV